MKTYTIIGGVNGVGKSSLSGSLKHQYRDLGTIIDVDLLTAKLGVGPIQGGKRAIELIHDCLQKGICFTQETTLSGTQVEHTARAARERHYRIRMFYVGLDTVEECLKRIRNRIEKGGHDIPAPTVERRFAKREDALLRVLPYCDEAFLFDNENGFVLVAEFRNGEIVPLTEKRPLWLRSLIERISLQ